MSAVPIEPINLKAIGKKCRMVLLSPQMSGKATVSMMLRLVAIIERQGQALARISDQPLNNSEVKEKGQLYDDGDFKAGYEMFVKDARKTSADVNRMMAGSKIIRGVG